TFLSAFFFFTLSSPTEISTLSLHDALPICWDPVETWAFITWVLYASFLHARATAGWRGRRAHYVQLLGFASLIFNILVVQTFIRSEEHTSELQSHLISYAVFCLKKKNNKYK